MEKRRFDNLGLEVALLGYGGMRFPVDEKGNINVKEAEMLIDIAYKNGVNYYDTAYFYHDYKCEAFIGNALSKYSRDSYYLATKLPCWNVNDLNDAKRLFNEQLERLNKDYIDFYLLHALNKDAWDKMKRLGILEYCDELKKQGKIKHFGFSFHDSYEVFEEIINDRNWDFCLIQLNYMDTNEQAGIKGYRLATDLGVPVIVMEPVKGGALAKLPQDAASILQKENRHASAASWALRWVGSLDKVTVILSGMSNIDQLQDNLNTFNCFKPLSQSEQKAIDQVAALMNQRVFNGCTGCNYCMPCPKGVDIPLNFSLWNNYGVYEDSAGAKWQWEHSIKQSKKAENCVDCGLCVKVCPQKIEIPKDLSSLQLQFDNLG